MAHVMTNAAATNSLSPMDSWLNDIRKRFNDYRVFRRTLADLRRLSPEELEDIGLSETPIRDIARVSAAAQH